MRACKKIRILLNAVLIIALVMPFRTQHEPAVVFRDLNYQFEIEKMRWMFILCGTVSEVPL
jgi:hypothetical protein